MPKRIPTADPEIVQYENGTYVVRVGNRERSLKTKDFAEACKKKRVILDKLDTTGERAGRLKVGDLWDDYLEFRRENSDLGAESGMSGRRMRRKISKTTFNEINTFWRLYLNRFWARVRLDSIDEEKWLDFVQESTLADLTNPRKVFRGFLKWAKSKKYVKYVPDMPIPPVDKRKRKVLTPDEIKKLFEHAEGNVLLFVSMYLFMGMRRKEIMTLRWSHVFFDTRQLHLRKVDVKTRNGRVLPINDFVLSLLADRKQGQLLKAINSPFVFPHAKDQSRHADLSGLKTAWNTIMRKCCWPRGYITPHDLRATFEAYAHKSKDFTDTQREKFAGASIDVQKKIYVSFTADDLRGLESVVQVDGLSEILSEKKTTLGKTRGETKCEKLH